MTAARRIADVPRSPRAEATTPTTAAGSVTGARLTIVTSRPLRSRWAISRARRIFPTPQVRRA